MATDRSIAGGRAIEAEYALGASEELGTEQLDHISTLFDRHTTGVLESVGVTTGWRCLDLGSGAGTIAGWLADRVGPEGAAVAVDTDTSRLRARPGLQVLQHDINDRVPGGPYDLIHARLLLMHLSRREQVLQTLADALAPGGWLVTGDFIGPQGQVLSSPSAGDTEVFHRVQEVAHYIVGRGLGMSLDWAREADGAMTRAGLRNIETVEYTQTSAGGSPGCLLSLNYIQQVPELLIKAGITEDELERYAALMHHPGFRAWFYPFVYSRGQRDAWQS